MSAKLQQRERQLHSRLCNFAISQELRLQIYSLTYSIQFPNSHQATLVPGKKTFMKSKDRTKVFTNENSLVLANKSEIEFQ